MMLASISHPPLFSLPTSHSATQLPFQHSNMWKPHPSYLCVSLSEALRLPKLAYLFHYARESEIILVLTLNDAADSEIQTWRNISFLRSLLTTELGCPLTSIPSFVIPMTSDHVLRLILYLFASVLPSYSTEAEAP